MARQTKNFILQSPIFFVSLHAIIFKESQMAIAIAREGGIGVIHKNMPIEEQARQAAIDEFGADIDENEIRLVRIKFISEMAN